jgi:hypothetical protein
MDDRHLEKLLRDTLQKLGVRIRVEKLEDGDGGVGKGGGFCRLDHEPLVVLSSIATSKQRIDILVSALRQLDTSGIFIPPAVRDLLDDN